MADFLLELLSEEIPARMQASARNDLARLFAECIQEAGLGTGPIDVFSTPRRLVLIARDVVKFAKHKSIEVKGPRTSAPPQALEGFLRKVGKELSDLEDRDGVYFLKVDMVGLSAEAILQDAILKIVTDFSWPKSMRWGDGSLRWVRPLHGIVAMLGEEIVPVEIDGIVSGATTVGHRFHHPGAITVGGASDYAEKLRACHVIVDQEERERIIREGAEAAAARAGLTLLADEGLVVENAGLTEWPVPLLGEFDEDFLDVPREVIVLTMRTNQKYFACTASDGGLAPAFVCVANVAAKDDGAAIVEGNRRVLAARLADARFFWEQDLKVPLEEQAKKLGGIVFHEKLGTVADKVERVAKLARWLVESGVVNSSPERGGGPAAKRTVEGASSQVKPPLHQPPAGPPPHAGEDLADQVERAAHLAKADLVTGMVGEFPELQGVIGGYLAEAQGEPKAVAEAIRDHYKPVGQGDEVPTVPVAVALALADRLDTVIEFFSINERPTGSKDPFALRRAILGCQRLDTENRLGVPWGRIFFRFGAEANARRMGREMSAKLRAVDEWYGNNKHGPLLTGLLGLDAEYERRIAALEEELSFQEFGNQAVIRTTTLAGNLLEFFADRLKVQQREAGVRHDLIDAVFSLGNERNLLRLLARVNALQSFVETREGADLLTGYKRAANILKREKWGEQRNQTTDQVRGGSLEPQEAALITALDKAEPKASAAIEKEDFTAAMAVLASLRKPIDDFFDHVTVNDPDPAKREWRLNLLMRFRNAVNRVADFSKIEG